jgi:hypothetical protein
LKEGRSRTVSQVAAELKLGFDSAMNAVGELFRSGILPRTEKRVRGQNDSNHGKLNRPQHLFTVRQEEEKRFENGFSFISYRLYNEQRDQTLTWKIREYFKANYSRKAVFAVDLWKKLLEAGVECSLEMVSTVLNPQLWNEVYRRGYQRGDGTITPFEKGYVLTWLSIDSDRERALREAVERTERLLQDVDPCSPMLQRVRKVYDAVTDMSLRRDICSSVCLMNVLGCTPHQVEEAIKRTLSRR